MVASGKGRRVALIEMLADRAFDPLSRGVLDYASEHLQWEFAGKPFWPYLPVEEAKRDHADGVIGNFHEASWRDRVMQNGVKVVDTSNRFDEVLLPRVTHDDKAIAQLAAAYLMGLGFTNLGYVGTSYAWFSQRRMEYFKAELERAGRNCHVCMGMWYVKQDGVLMREWIKSLPKPVAIFAVMDYFGVLALEIAIDLGLRVPEDVAVLGVGNEWRSTAMTRPPMSSIELNSRQVGYQAAKMLDALMSGQKPSSPQWVPPIGVVARRSTDIQLADDPLVVDALAIIRDRCAKGLLVEELLDALQVSRRTLENRMKRSIGHTPQVAIHQAQIARAKTVLQNSRANLWEVAEACGFDRQDQFCTVFKRLTGLTPGAYRRQVATLSRI